MAHGSIGSPISMRPRRSPRRSSTSPLSNRVRLPHECTNVMWTDLDNPPLGSTGCDQQACKSFLSGEVRFVQMKATTFLVRAKGLDPEAFGLPVTRLLR